MIFEQSASTQKCSTYRNKRADQVEAAIALLRLPYDLASADKANVA
jgi:hypothetical protein